MHAVFRVDASVEIGSGHLMRCLALAGALREGGAKCSFLCRSFGLEMLADQIIADGHELLLLTKNTSVVDSDGPTHASWLPGGHRNDAEACLSILKERRLVDWLIVDHYALDQRWHSLMRGAVSRIMVIDDLADRPHDCDLLLDQNLIQDMQGRYDNLVPAKCVRLLGPRYALLREEFVRHLEPEEQITREIPRLLIMFGGADNQNLTQRAVEQLVAIDWPGDVDVVAGPLYRELSSLQAATSRLTRGHLHAPAKNIGKLMRRAGLALGSPGVASWERCAFALPAITIAQSDNQEGVGRALGEVGASLYLGRAESLSDDVLKSALRTLLVNNSALKAMSRAAAAVCDGDGRRRVAVKLMPPSVSIRRVSLSDAAMLFLWRNDERTRRYALDSKPLILTDHITWVERILARSDVDLLLVVSKNTPVACVRFNREGSHARVSIYANPELQGAGLGAAALFASLEWLRNHHPEIRATKADVLPDNKVSHALFKSAGYQLAWFHYERSAEAACTC